jgi:hypothetical protein
MQHFARGIQIWDKGCPLQNCPLELKDFFHHTSPISTLRESSPTQKQKGQDLFLSLSLLTLRTPLPKHRALSQEKRGALDTRGKAVNTVEVPKQVDLVKFACPGTPGDRFRVPKSPVGRNIGAKVGTYAVGRASRNDPFQ